MRTFYVPNLGNLEKYGGILPPTKSMLIFQFGKNWWIPETDNRKLLKFPLEKMN